MKSQTDEILAYLKSGKSITASYAVTRFRCFRLAARIYDLRNRGYSISTEIKVYLSRRTGRKIQAARYRLVS